MSVYVCVCVCEAHQITKWNWFTPANRHTIRSVTHSSFFEDDFCDCAVSLLLQSHLIHEHLICTSQNDGA